MIKVAHVLNSYLAQSETFIWQYLHKFKAVYPVVISESWQNLDQFSLARGKLCKTNGPRLTPLWFIDNFYRRILKQPHGHLKRIIEKNGIQVLHAHFGPTGVKCLPVSRSLNIPMITNFYGYDLSIKHIVEQNIKAYNELFAEGTHFLVEGPAMRDRLVSLGCPGKKI